MEFKDIKKGVIDNGMEYGEKFGVKIDKDFGMLKLQEEVGEATQAYLIAERRSRPEKLVSPEEAKLELGKELADVMCMTILNAHLNDIDLEEMIKIKWLVR